MRPRRRRIESETELNLVPMLDMFLSLIPFLLMSAVLASFGGIYVEAPSYSTAMQEKKDEKKELDIAVQVENGKVSIFGFRNGFETKVPEVKGQFDLKDYAGLRAYLVELQTKYKKVRSSLFHAAADIRYEDAIAVLNIIRATDVTDNLVLAVGAVQ